MTVMSWAPGPDTGEPMAFEELAPQVRAELRWMMRQLGATA